MNPSTAIRSACTAANPDGTGLELYYGENSHATGANIAGTNNNVIQFLNARQRADGKLIAIVRPFLGTQQGGDMVQIDAAGYVEINQPATPTGGAGPAQSSATTLGVTTDAEHALPGRPVRLGLSSCMTARIACWSAGRRAWCWISP